MFKRTKLSSGLLLAFGGTLALSVAAQTGERVEITGSRIKTIEVEGASPVISLGIESIKIDAVRNVESLLNNLPQVFADYGATVSNGATGTATVNLRNMGAGRTLVLMNGRRVPAGSPRLVAADLNQIPLSLIKRVDVLTGGASAVYGADAVAGVVNFVMNDRFEGLQLEANHQFNNHTQNNPSDVQASTARRGFPTPGDIDADGQITDFSITAGGNFAGGKGNATVYFGYKKEDALLQSERDFSACSLAPANATATTPARFNCGGSSTSFPGRFITDNGNFTVADAAGNTRTWTSAADAYNFGPLNYFQRPSQRYSIAAFARYDINSYARTYLEASFHDDATVAQIAPSGLFGFDASGTNAIKSENPLLSAAWRTALGLGGPGTTADALIFRRNVEGGGRQDDIRHSSYRTVVGVKGDVGAWSYDAFGQVGRVVYQETYKNDFSITRSARALDIVTNPANGQPVCRSVLDGSDPACVPYNIWSLGKITPEALAYLQTPGFQKGFTAQNVLGATASVDLGQYGLKVPGAKTGIQAAFGFERRSEKLDLSTDTAFTTGDLAGQGGPTISVGGQYSVRDLFMELNIPLLEKAPFAESMNLTATYRNSDYSTGAKTDTYGVGLDWAATKAFKIRGSVQRAARAPNVLELFSAQSLGLYNNDEDPCAGTTPTATREQCARTGVTAAQYGTVIDNPAGQYNALFGGNPKLNPETADTTTVGIVVTPLRDLSITLDYFNIKIKDVISNLDPAIALQQCLVTGNPLFCSKVHRDSRGTLWATPAAFIEAGNANLSQYKTEGVDLGVDYRMAIGGMGRLDFNLLGTYLKKLSIEPTPGLGTYDCVGLYGGTCGTPVPEWRHKFRATWSTPWNLDLAATWRYFGAVKDEVTSSNPLLNGAVLTLTEKFKAMHYFDVAASYNLNKVVTLRASISNLFDKDPPLAATGAPFGNGNTYPVVYDTLGRRISLNLTAKF